MGQIFTVCHDFLLKLNCMCGFRKLSRHWCSLLKGTSKTQLCFLTDKHTRSMAQDSNNSHSIPEYSGILTIHVILVMAGNQNRAAGIKQIKLQSNLFRGRRRRGPFSKPREKDTRDSHSLDKWFCKWIYSLGCVSDTCCFNSCRSKMGSYVTQCLDEENKANNNKSL